MTADHDRLEGPPPLLEEAGPILPSGPAWRSVGSGPYVKAPRVHDDPIQARGVAQFLEAWTATRDAAPAS